jgi:hypothetical protein
MQKLWYGNRQESSIAEVKGRKDKMRFHRYHVTVQSDHGSFTFAVVGSSKESAARQVMAAEHCPLRAIRKIVDKGSILQQRLRRNPYRKSLREFLREHREELDEAIQRVAPGAPRNDYERELWIHNDEGLYRWARSEGVRL